MNSVRLTFAPCPPGSDDVQRHYNEGLRRAFRRAVGAIGEDDDYRPVAQLTLGAARALPRQAVTGLLTHPIVAQAILEIDRRGRAGQPPSREQVADLAGAFALTAARAAVEWREPIALGIAREGVLTLGGAGHTLRLVGDGEVHCTSRGRRLNLFGDAIDPLSVNVDTGSTEFVPTATAGRRIEVDARHARVRRVIERANAAPRVAPYPHRNLHGVDPVPSSYLALLNDALGAIETAWPALGNEIARTVHQIVPFDGVPVGFTDAALQGAIFVQRVDADPSFAVEHLVHEASHSRMHMMERTVALFRGTGLAQCRSPWRRDPRPVAGVFHGLFVFGRLIVLTGRCPRGVGVDALIDRRAAMLEQFESARVALEGCDELPPPARALLCDVVEAVRNAAPAACRPRNSA